MRENVIGCYEAINEDGRLYYNNVRQVEFRTNMHYLKRVISSNSTVLDCCCGTGAYSIPLSEECKSVFAYDLTPKHISILNDKIKERDIKNIQTGICDAQRMDMFDDASFDAVVCMGALYHLMTIDEQIRCINECKRIVKKNGILVFSYLNRSSILPYILKNGKENFFNKRTIEKFLSEKCTQWGIDEFCFFTDSYYHIPEEIEAIMLNQSISKIHHVGSDGLSYDFEEFVNQLNSEDFETWLFYHYQVCEQFSMLGASQHGLFIGRL